MDHSILIRPQRKRLRWRSHDYAADATYFVTICTLDRQCVFGDVTDGVVRRTAVGDVVDACWRAIPDHYPEVTLDAWVPMPNHLHGILTIGEELSFTVGAGHGRPNTSSAGPNPSSAGPSAGPNTAMASPHAATAACPQTVMTLPPRSTLAA